MITIPLTTEDLTKVRIASSPLWETVDSFGVLLHHGRHTVRAPWVARARRVLPDTDLVALGTTMCVERACPDFLTPPPGASASTFGEELERLRATPLEVVLEEVEALVGVEKGLFGRLDPAQERLLETYLKIVHPGFMDNVVPTIQTLALWTEATGYRSAAYNREPYLECHQSRDARVTELQEPLTTS